MKPNEVPMPDRLARLPRDARGYPITFTVMRLPNGDHDFTTSDPFRWREALSKRLCGLCGEKLERKIWFIGGPKCIANRFFFDHPMHEECARYALVVCPYLAMPSYLGAKTHKVPEELRKTLVSSDSTKPVAFGLASTTWYRGVLVQGDTLLQAGPWVDLEWWVDGKRQ